MPPDPCSPAKPRPRGAPGPLAAQDLSFKGNSLPLEGLLADMTSSEPTSWQEEEWDYDLGQDDDDGDDDEEEEDDDDHISSYQGLHIVKATVTGFVTQKQGLHIDYIFVVEVTWSDQTTHAVKRTYSDFQHFHYALMEEYARSCRTRRRPPESANPSKLGTYLPGQLAGKADDLAQAEQRELQLNQYVQELIKLPPRVSACPLVLTYFESRTSDPKPYKGAIDQSKEEVADQYVLCWI